MLLNIAAGEIFQALRNFLTDEQNIIKAVRPEIFPPAAIFNIQRDTKNTQQEILNVQNLTFLWCNM
jgi:hypothetical protein